MADPVAYWSPWEPGAPKMGDLVVCEHGRTVRVAGFGATGGNRWDVEDTTSTRDYLDTFTGHFVPGPWRYSVAWVRRPTEAELATWALEGSHG